MAERVVLHVGAMKSGTSFIQGQLFANKAILEKQGVHVPGRVWRDQVIAVSEIVGNRRYDEEMLSGAWQRMVDTIAELPGTAVVSMEFLGPQPRAKIAAIAGSFTNTRVSVVLTVRDLNRNMAAMWQETVQNGNWWTFTDYRNDVRGARPGVKTPPDESNRAGPKFWRQQNFVRLARSWRGAEGVDDFTIVTVPHPGAPRQELMTRFGDAVGIDTSEFRPAARENASLDAPATEVLRRTNELLVEGGLVYPQGLWLRKHRLAKGVLTHHRRSDMRIGLPVTDWVRNQSRRMVASLQRQEISYVGDLADLAPVDMPGVDPDALTDDELLPVAQHALEDIESFLARKFGPNWYDGPTPEAADGELDLTVRRLAAVVGHAIEFQAQR
jgi:hypothetical protein